MERRGDVHEESQNIWLAGVMSFLVIAIGC